MEERISNLEKRAKEMKKDIENVKNQIDVFGNNFIEIKNMIKDIHKSIKNKLNDNQYKNELKYEDKSGNLNNPKNPFIIAINNINKNNHEDDNISDNREIF